MQEFSVIRAGEADIPLIRRLAEIVWREHYPAIIGTEQVEFMLQKMYAAESLSAQMLQQGHVFFLCLAAAEPIGFFALHTPAQGQGFIPKFYLFKEFRGSGAAAFMMQEAEAFFRKANCREIRLQVNRLNTGAINFYFKQGFKIERAADFDIGEGYSMNDFIMLRKLAY